MTSGIDVSSYQGAINFGQVQGAGVTWVGMRVLHQSKDVYFDANRIGFSWARHRLFYHYLDPGNPVAQADRFLNIVGTLAPGEGCMLDAEGGLTVPDAKAWCDHVEQKTQRPVAIYTGGYVDGGKMWRDPLLNTPSRARIFAAYSTEEKARNTHAAGIPWDAWQFTSSGLLPGIHGSVDLDRVDNPGKFDQVCAVNPPPPPPPSNWAPLQHQYGDYPKTPNKPELKFGDGYAVDQADRPFIEYFKLVAVIEAGQNTYGSPWFVYEIYAVQACQMIQRFFGLLITGVVDAATWRVIDFLAGPRPR